MRSPRSDTIAGKLAECPCAKGGAKKQAGVNQHKLFVESRSNFRDGEPTQNIIWAIGSGVRYSVRAFDLQGRTFCSPRLQVAAAAKTRRYGKECRYCRRKVSSL